MQMRQLNWNILNFTYMRAQNTHFALHFVETKVGERKENKITTTTTKYEQRKGEKMGKKTKLSFVVPYTEQNQIKITLCDLIVYYCHCWNEHLPKNMSTSENVCELLHNSVRICALLLRLVFKARLHSIFME